MRRGRFIKSARHYRANPLSDTALYGGIAAGVVVLGIGAYFIAQKYGTPAAPVAGQLTAAQLADQQAALNYTGIYAVPPAPPGGLNTGA
jgi:hypothetical protein